MTNIRKHRQRLKLTQAEVAEKLNVTPQAVTQWESGARNPDIIKLKKLAALFKCSADELLEPVSIENSKIRKED